MRRRNLFTLAAGASAVQHRFARSTSLSRRRGPRSARVLVQVLVLVASVFAGVVGPAQADQDVGRPAGIPSGGLLGAVDGSGEADVAFTRDVGRLLTAGGDRARV